MDLRINFKLKLIQMRRHVTSEEQSPNVHTNVDGSPMNSRRILQEDPN